MNFVLEKSCTAFNLMLELSLSVRRGYMSGHSKWSTIKNKKEKADSARAKIFTKISREIYVAVKNFGADVDSNRKLRDLIFKAKANNLPGENIERVIKKAAGDVNKNCYEEVLYEGYGPGGVAILVEALTDNRNRTASNIRHYFSKFGGKLGAAGCVGFMFNSKGFVGAQKEGLQEDEAMEISIELGATDFELDGDLLNLYLPVSTLYKSIEYLKNEGFKILFAETRKVADNLVDLGEGENFQKFNNLVQSLDDDDDVQRVWTNIEWN